MNSIENDDWSESNNESDTRRDSSSRRAMWFNVDQLAKAKEIRGAKLHCDDDERYTGTSRYANKCLEFFNCLALALPSNF